MKIALENDNENSEEYHKLKSLSVHQKYKTQTLKAKFTNIVVKIKTHATTCVTLFKQLCLRKTGFIN